MRKTRFQTQHKWVDHIPIIWIDAVEPTTPRKLAIWLPWFSENKEAMIPYLEGLARNGYTALSCDPWQHGERAKESQEALVARVFGNFQRYMWPILAHTSVDLLRVLDWAIETLDAAPCFYLGGISMGGDISIAAAGIDQRIKCVSALNATPDWMRPGMDMDGGCADAYAVHLYNRLNPMTHLDAYAHCPAISFECGADDNHVPPDGALRFKEALKKTYKNCPDKFQVNLHDGVAHESTDEMWQNSLAWFARAQSLWMDP